jgi:hypothetical protein
VTRPNSEELGSLVHTLLRTIYVDERAAFDRLSAVKCLSLEQLAAGAVAATLRNRFDAPKRNGR